MAPSSSGLGQVEFSTKPRVRMATTYILTCANTDYYIGSTINIEHRLNEHQCGQSRATKGKRPVKLIYKRNFSTLKEARKFEYFLKRQRNKKFFKKLFNGEIIWPHRLVA